VRLNRPVRAITQQRRPRARRGRRALGHGASRRGVGAARARARDRVRSAAARDRQALYRNAIGGQATKTIAVYDEPFWRADGFSGQTAEPGSPVELTIDAGRRPAVRACSPSFAFGPNR
jgi:monoamine oxidase